MKKIFFLTAFFIVTNMLYSQFTSFEDLRYKINASVVSSSIEGYSVHKYEKKYHKYKSVYDNLWGYSLGISAITPSDLFFGIEPGVRYVTRGYHRYNEMIYIDYIDIYSKFRLNWHNDREWANFSPYFGMGMAFRVRTNEKNTSVFDTNLSVGVDFIFYDKISIGTEINRGTTNIRKNFRGTNRTLFVNVGWIL